MHLLNLEQAIAARRSILNSPHTDCARLVDGDADDFPGVYLETFAGHWLVSTLDAPVPRPIVQLAQQENRSLYHKPLRQTQKSAPLHLCGPPLDQRFSILENSQQFWIDFTAGYSQGLFLDQRDNRQRLRQLIQPGSTVLNTFAYTGGFSISAALGGATVTTLDLSQPYLEWAKDNFRLNQLDPGQHYFCKGDTLHWLKRFAKSARQFDAIVLDPPTFSRDAKGKTWRAEKDYTTLAQLALNCLAPGGFILATTNCHKLTPDQFQQQIQSAILSNPSVDPHMVKLEPAAMPTDFPDLPYLKTLWLHTNHSNR